MKSKFLFFLLLAVIFLPLPSLALSNSDCFDCHGDPDFSKELPNGKTISLYVDEKRFKNSVHGINDISCTECHSEITELNYDNEVPHPTKLKPVDCSQCHEEESKAFKESVHAELGEDGPRCKDCHNPHYTTYMAAKRSLERNRESCLKCHAPEKSHDFLPAKKLHLKVIGCSVCHSSEGEKLVRLYPYSITKEKTIQGEEIANSLGIDLDSLQEVYDKNKDGKLETEEIKNLLSDIKLKGLKVSLKGELVSSTDPSNHKISSEGISDCSQCHSCKAPFFNKVVLSFSKKTGESVDIPVDKRFLKSIYPVRFYVLDSTKITLVDIIGALIVLGGVAFAAGHCTLRILTIPLRKKKKEA